MIRPKINLARVLLCVLLQLCLHDVIGDCGAATNEHVCSSAIKTTFYAAFEGVPWAVEMADACGKPQTGMMRHGFELQSSVPDVPRHAIRLVGNPDQCLLVQVPEDFKTQYCTVHLKIKKLGQAKFSTPKDVFIGMCVPDVCRETELGGALSPYFRRIPFVTAKVKDVICQEKEKALDKKATGAIVTLAVIITLVVLGTAYELLVVGCKQSKCEQKPIQAANNEVDKNITAPSTSEKEIKPGFVGKCLLSFSAYSNASRILSTQEASGHLEFLDGMRVLTAMWLVFGHVFIEGHNMMENFVHELEAGKEKLEGPIVNCFNFGTDIFLSISGFLTVFHTLKKFQSQKPSFKFFKDFIINRYWRLTPHYALVMFVYVSLFKYVVDGPLVSRAPIEVNDCGHTWWANVLYVNFLYPVDQCMVWTWYLTCDMIFHVISPLIVLAFFYYGWRGLLVPLSMIVGSSAISGYISYTHELFAFRNDNPDYEAYITHYYPHPYTRIGPFLVGTIVGYIFYKSKGNATIPKGCKLFGWGTSMALTLTVFGTCYYSQAVRSLTTMEAAVANAVLRTMFAVASSWVIYVCAMGQGGFVGKFLSWDAFKPLSKLSFGLYLVHPALIRFYVRGSRRLIFFNETFLIFFYEGLLAIAFLVSMVTTLLFEMPFSNLYKVVHDSRKESRSKSE